MIPELFAGVAERGGEPFPIDDQPPAGRRVLFFPVDELLEAGVDHASVFQRVEQMDRPARLRLLGRALASLELHGDEQIALMCMRRSDFQDCCGDQEDAGGLTDMLLTVAPVRIAASLTEIEGERTKVSLRSKRSYAPGQQTIDVNEIARRLNGGGHAQAAGARLDLPLEEAKRRVIETLVQALDQETKPSR